MMHQMNPYLLIAIVIQSIYFNVIKSDYCPRADNDSTIYSSSFNGSYILLQGGVSGLSNRLGVMAAVLHIAELRNVPFVVFTWSAYDTDWNNVKKHHYPDNSHFLELFQPISNCIFINSNQYESFKSNMILSFPNCGGWGFYHAIYNCGCGYELQDENPIHHTIRINSYKKYFVLTWENRREVLEFVQNHDICNAAAIHVRKTDLTSGTTDEDFFRFINSQPKDRRIFLLTDNSKTRHDYISMFGQDRIITYGTITGPTIHRPRHTSIRHFIIEIFIATYSIDYMGSQGSTASELVSLFKEAYNETISDYCNHLSNHNVSSIT